MAEHKLFKVNQHIILENNEGKVLLLRQNGGWMLPGGRLESGETWIEGLRREVYEEIGVDDFEIDTVIDARTSESGNTYAVTFIGTAVERGNVVLSSEHQNVKWFSADEIGELEFVTREEKEILLRYV